MSFISPDDDRRRSQCMYAITYVTKAIVAHALLPRGCIANENAGG